MSTPRMITPAYAVHEGNHLYLQDIDLTAPISAIGMRNIDKIIAWSEGKKPLVDEIWQSLSGNVRDIAVKGQLYLPEFTTHLKAFLEEVPTEEAMRSLHNHLREIDRVRWKAEDLQRLLNKVRTAHFEPDVSLHPVYFDVDHEEAYRDLDSLVEDLAATFADEFDGHPEAPHGSVDYSAWEQTFNDFLKSKAPPFVFGCKNLLWNGVSEQDVRSLHEKWGRITLINIESMLDGLLERHHDAARDYLVDPQELEEVIFRWQEAEGQGGSFDLAGKLTNWNAKQNIVSFYPDNDVILPLFPKVTHEEAIRWCEQKLSHTRNRLEALDEGWRSPENTPKAAPGA